MKLIIFWTIIICWCYAFLRTWLLWNHIIKTSWIIRIKRNGILVVLGHILFTFLFWPLVLLYSLFLIDWVEVAKEKKEHKARKPYCEKVGLL